MLCYCWASVTDSDTAINIETSQCVYWALKYLHKCVSAQVLAQVRECASAHVLAQMREYWRKCLSAQVLVQAHKCLRKCADRGK